MPATTPAISVSRLDKIYASGFQALKNVNLDIRHGEIFALLGPNGAGKTTLIGIICGIVNPSAGTVRVDGHDIISDYRAARSLIGLVPQELTTDAFETPPATLRFSRGLFGKSANPDYIDKVLKQLSLWDKRHDKIRMLSGGMKRRLMIAKALAHEPQILFLDEPTAGVTSSCARICGSWCARCGRPASPSSSPPITSKKRRKWPIASGSSIMARSSWSKTRPSSCANSARSS